MGGIKWTIPGYDEEWLEARIPDYVKFVGQQRVRNDDQRAWVSATIKEYHEKFPGHSDSWYLSAIGYKGAPEKRAEKIRDVSTFYCAYMDSRILTLSCLALSKLV